MSTDANGPAHELERRIKDFLGRNFPQIRMHGGTAVVEELDTETGEVTVRLDGACSGCGISPMTIQAIESRMPEAIPDIESVHAETGDTGESRPAPSFPGEPGDDAPSPF